MREKEPFCEEELRLTIPYCLYLCICVYTAVLQFTYTLQISLLFYITNMVNYSFLNYVSCDIYCNHLLTISITYCVMAQNSGFYCGGFPLTSSVFINLEKRRCKLENLFQQFYYCTFLFIRF
jgi:hypothetical protein